MSLGEDSYDIIVERGILKNANKSLNIDRRVLVVTDSGVPEEYAKALAAQCKEGIIYTAQMGEVSKSLNVFGELLQTMLDHGFSRKDCVVAVGGGLIFGDNTITVPKQILSYKDIVLDGHNDHRIVMAMSVILSKIGGTISGAEAIKKSYPGFFEDIKGLGAEVTLL